MADENKPVDTSKFGKCCDGLKDAMTGDDFDPLIAEEDGVLYLAVGLVEMEDEEQGMVDHPLFYCPFCGTKVQDPEEVKAKIGDGEEEAPAKN